MADTVSNCCYKCWFPTPKRQNGSVLCGNGKEMWSDIGEKMFPLDLVNVPAQYVWIGAQLISNTWIVYSKPSQGYYNIRHCTVSSRYSLCIACCW